jgi:RimJ/RimL family protein N-acetyltransferase
LSCFIRKAGVEDALDILNWRNHPKIRENSFSSMSIKKVDHIEWFKEKIRNKNSYMYIYCNENDKIGVIRFDLKGKTAVVSIMLNPDFIGMGIGEVLIKEGTNFFLLDTKKQIVIKAEIKAANIASIKAFSNAGYKEERITLTFRIQ